ncbi:MAG: DNA-binding protein [Desulforudis sp.]|nr:MAG: DNA-binding protein [Desulforudis sp.]
MIKSAVPSKHGLYPHEVLMLDYAKSFYTESNSLPGFWWYSYGVRDVDNGLRSLLDRGFLQIGDLQSAIEKEKATVIKDELKNRGLKTSGKKAELVKRLLEEAPHEELSVRFAKRTYQLTDLGKQALDEESYVPYIHRHQFEDLDIWSLNKIVHTPPYMPWRDKIWGYLNKRSIKHAKAGDFGLYRNCRYQMHLFLMEEKRIKDALAMLAEVVFYDLSGLDNGYDPRFMDISAKYFFPYKESNATTAPGVISAIMKCKEELGFTDEELKEALLDRMNKLSVPFHLFTPEECVDIVFMENRQDEEALAKIYAEARRRFKQQYPNIKC